MAEELCVCILFNKLTYYILCFNIREVFSKMADEAVNLPRAKGTNIFYYIMLAKVAMGLYTVYSALFYN